MNKLPLETRVQILTMLVEGSSMRSISRVCDVSINTVSKLLVDAGTVCAAFHDAKVRDVKAEKIQCDEIWSFNFCKKKNVEKAKSAPDSAGDVWTFTAIEATSKLIVSWLVGDRDRDTACSFMDDLQSRLENRVQLTTDGFKPYVSAVAGAFGIDKIDFAQLVKVYEATSGGGQGRYSPARFVSAQKKEWFGDPKGEDISTSYVERQNLTMRMSMRRFTRLTNAFSKKFENHCHALALYFYWYNWVRAHKAHKLTPAMAAGLTASPMEMADLVAMIDVREIAALSRRRQAMLEAAE